MQDSLLHKADKQSSRDISTFLVGTLLALSVLLNVALARKIASLRAQNSSASAILPEGSPVPPLVGYSVDGAPISFRFGDVRVPTVLYVFSPQCGWCAKNIENFRLLIAQAGSGYRIVGLSTTRQDLKSYLSTEQLTLPVLADVDPSIVAAYKLGGTPTTIVISPEGKVLKVWIGAYQDGVRQEIERSLGVRLHPCCHSANTESKSIS